MSTARVLLIDEADKSDVDLPNDLLNLLEEGEFRIPELVRIAETDSEVEVSLEHESTRVRIRRGTVRCHAFPIVVMTSNGQRVQSVISHLPWNAAAFAR